jgi:hypothetical protein|tara:strand:+ start:643 stop:1110 length:468 start_codon:yes stop_codon:yes gene_type:complete
METKQLKIKTNDSKVVEFMFDSPKQGTNNYGNWNLYGLKCDGEDVSLFATDNLHSKIQFYQKGDIVEIAKNETEQGRIYWDVTPRNGTPVRDASNSTVKQTSTTVDDRTADIHKQVCLKLAVQSMGTEFDITEIESRMYSLLSVLHGNESDGLPI